MSCALITITTGDNDTMRYPAVYVRHAIIEIESKYTHIWRIF